MATISSLKDYHSLCATFKKNPEKVRVVFDQSMKRVEKYQALNAVVENYQASASVQMEAVIEKLKSGKAGKAAGMMVGIKDLFCYKDHPVQGASQILKGFVSKITATAVERLLKEDAIVLHRQNNDEFGMGSATTYSLYGPTKNGIDPSRVAGGSSGGSAVAVQMGMCDIALGTDTGGSVRQPAAFCGIYGYKPTYGMISRYGVLAYASSFDTVGIFGRSLEDIARALTIMAGKDGRDHTVWYNKSLDFSQAIKKKAEKKYRIAYFTEAIENPLLEKSIKKQSQSFLKKIEAAGDTTHPLSFPFMEYILPTYYILTTAEARSNLARYDGGRYGHRSKAAKTYQEMIKKTRTEGFGEEVKRRILLGTAILSAKYEGNLYKKGQKVRRKIVDYLDKILENHDFILLPTTPTTAFKFEDVKKTPMQNYLADIYTVIASIAGLPALSIPVGHDEKGLPIGLQIIGKRGADDALLNYAKNMTQNQ